MLRMTEAQFAAAQARAKPPGAHAVGKVAKSLKYQSPPIGAQKRKPEDMLAAEMTAAGLKFERQYRWHPGRKYRADFGLPERRLIIEVEGCVHRIEDKFHRDIEKGQEALLQGWTLLRVSNAQVRAGEALGVVLSVLGPKVMA